MPSLSCSRSLARIRNRTLPFQTTPPESIHSDRSVPASSPVNVPPSPFARFDIEKTFPAILAPYALLCKAPETQDINALRALAPVFAHCLDAILHSMARLPEHVPTSSKYHLALSSVNFSKDMFLGHVGRIPIHVRSSARREVIQVAMHFLDMTMSSLKSFLSAAAYEAAQLKPLPQIPVEEDDPAQARHELAAMASRSAPSVSSSDGHHTASIAGTLASSGSGDALDPQRGPKVAAALLKPLRSGPRKKPPHLDLARVDSCSTLVNTNSDDLSHGYVHVSVNIRNSLAQFPVSVDPAAGNMRHPEDAMELWKDRNGLAQLASLKALVRYMTSPDADSDVEIVDVFFLCFRFFSSPKETLDALVVRYEETLTPQSASSTRSHSMQVRMRIAKLLYLWVDLHWREEDALVLNSLTHFVFARLAQDIPQEASSKLISSLHHRTRAGKKSKGHRKEKTIAHAEAKYRREVLTSTWEPREKRAMMRRDFSRVRLGQFHSSGGVSFLALQLTLLLWEKYRAFEPEDAVRYLMTRSGDDAATSEVARKVGVFMGYERALHRLVLDSIGSAESVQMRTELTEFFLELATKCHDLRNYSASCLIALACDRPTVLPFITKLKLSPPHERMKAKLNVFYTQENQHMAGYKQALQSCCCPALPGMMLFIREVARGCGSGAYDEHPDFPGTRLINLKRYRPITWAVRAMEKCHAPFRIQRVDYVCDWLEHVLSGYLAGTEVEWEKRIFENCRKL